VISFPPYSARFPVAPIAILFGSLLTALGAAAFYSPDLFAGGNPGQISAASPAFIGFPILLSGLLTALRPNLRKHAMHLAAVFGVLGVLGGLVPMFIRKFDFGTTAVQVGLGMTLLSGVFVFLCVRSFIQARKAREAAAAIPS
jgi:hypothetical protein